MSAALVVLAAGSGSRVGAEINKVLLPLSDTTVLGHSLRTALAVPDVRRIVVVVREGEQEAVAEAVTPVLGTGEVIMVAGGATRHASEWAALQVLRQEIERSEIDVVALHDAARPLASPELFTAVISTAREYGGALPATPVGGLTTRTLQPIEGPLVAVQTPQAFRADVLLDAYARASEDGFEGTDTAACLEVYAANSVRIAAVPSSPLNLKITFAEDIALVARLLD